jgi:uroporphyrin-III C-methyltransferase
MEYPAPQLGASLVLAFRPPKEARAIIVLLSPTRLTATRALMALEAGYQVWIGSAQEDVWDPELAFRLAEGQVHRLEWTLGADAGMDAWAQWFDGLSDELRERCSLVGLGDTLELGGGTGGKRSLASAQAFMSAAHRRRYIVNVADRPTLSDFSYPTTHRFPLSPPMTSSYTSPSLYADAASLTTASKSPLQVVVLTNSSACRLATRIKREIVAALPSNIGDSVAAIAHLRAELALEEDAMAEADGEAKGALNVPVRQLTVEQSRRMDTIVSSVDAPKGGSSCRGRSS